MKLDVLVIAAHPDDAELGVGGTILRLVAAQKKVGICDLTRGELGTRGTRVDREREASAASQALGLSTRVNLELPDGHVEANIEACTRLARILRELAPDTVLAQHVEDLHPDHAACGRLARDAWYLSGLTRLAERDGGPAARRPRRLFHYLGHLPCEPSLVVDVSPFWDAKVRVIRCYASQLAPAHAADRGEHLLFGADILARAETKARYWGERIGVRYGEPLLHVGPISATEAPLP
jgi:bacillithiol biosynthesis deacetylase BshB1